MTQHMMALFAMVALPAGFAFSIYTGFYLAKGEGVKCFTLLTLASLLLGAGCVVTLIVGLEAGMRDGRVQAYAEKSLVPNCGPDEEI